MTVCLVVALMPEAAPVIDHFKLREDHKGASIRVFRNDRIKLAISGIGTVASAAATGYLCATLQQSRTSAWLNIGIAGHGRRSVGEGAIAHRIDEMETGRRWYPPQTLATRLDSDNLNTSRSPVEHYGEDAFYDMEASGFYQTAIRFSSSELVQCYKVVSDNPDSPVSKINPDMARALIAARIEDIELLVGTMEELSTVEQQACRAPDLYEAFLARWSFTASQRTKLGRLLQRHEVLSAGRPLSVSDYETLASSRAVINALLETLDGLALSGGLHRD